jgi:hypothetical protein
LAKKIPFLRGAKSRWGKATTRASAPTATATGSWAGLRKNAFNSNSAIPSASVRTAAGRRSASLSRPITQAPARGRPFSVMRAWRCSE